MLIDLQRHGQPQGGDVVRSDTNHPLSDEGFAQKCRTGGLDARTDAGSLPWTQGYLSPLLHCRRFDENLSERFGLLVRIEPDWQEID